jgi:hypothetical protein
MPERAEIMSEAPGAGLDRRVAERVMSVPRLYLYQTPVEFGTIRTPGSDENDPAIRDHALSEVTPQYSTNLEDAWKIVEELNSRGWPFVVMLDEGGQVTAWTGRQAEVHAGGEESDSQLTVPEAICKAALLALESNESE